MAYIPYADVNDYLECVGGNIPQDELYTALKKASRHIDSLTFNRVVGHFEELTEFQKDVLKEVVCEQAEFEYSNKDVLDSIISNYSINGVSMSFGSNWNLHIENGVAMKKETYTLLEQTGLCCRLAGV